MPFTQAQKTTFKTDRNANTTSIQAFVAGQGDVLQSVQIKDVEDVGDNYQKIADWYNAVANPAYLAWRESVPQTEIMLNGFNWTRVDNLSVGKARIWEWMFDNPDKSINPSKPNIRAGIDAVWVGTQADLDVRAAVYVHCSRNVTAVEKLFVTSTPGGSGTRGTSANPDMMGFEGTISAEDVRDALLTG